MKTPKLLPWYAARAGVPIERAEVLWRRAVRDATSETGWVGNSEYWGAAMDHFRRHLERERATLCAPQVKPLLRIQERLWRAPFDAAGDFASIAMRHWQRYLNHGRKAA